MNSLFEVIALFSLIAGVCVVAFVFSGDPDLWDKWHQIAMMAATCKQ